MLIEYDSEKRVHVLEKRGIDFAELGPFFEGTRITRSSERNGEYRLVSLGWHKEIEIAVAHTIRNGRIRVISARRARDYERALLQDKGIGPPGDEG